MLTPFELSVAAWLGGGVVGAVVAKEHRVSGFVLGAILVGMIGDKYIENNHPWYTGPRTREEQAFADHWRQRIQDAKTSGR